jgi:hypothetical protein
VEGISVALVSHLGQSCEALAGGRDELSWLGR